MASYTTCTRRGKWVSTFRTDDQAIRLRTAAQEFELPYDRMHTATLRYLGNHFYRFSLTTIDGDTLEVGGATLGLGQIR